MPWTSAPWILWTWEVEEQREAYLLSINKEEDGGEGLDTEGGGEVPTDVAIDLDKADVLEVAGHVLELRGKHLGMSSSQKGMPCRVRTRRRTRPARRETSCACTGSG